MELDTIKKVTKALGNADLANINTAEMHTLLRCGCGLSMLESFLIWQTVKATREQINPKKIEQTLD